MISSLTTPSTFNSALLELHTSVMSLLDDMITQEADETLLNAYSEWVNGVWGPFYRAHEGAVGSASGAAFSAVMERLSVLHDEFVEWRTEFEGIGGTPDLPEPAPPPEPGGVFDFVTDAWKKGLIALGVTLGLVAAGYVGYKFYRARGNAPRLRKAA